MEQDCETGAPSRACGTALSAASHLPLSNFSSPWPVQGVSRGASAKKAGAGPKPGTSPERPPDRGQPVDTGVPPAPQSCLTQGHLE